MRAYIAVMEYERPLLAIPDDELLRRLGDLVSRSRGVEVDLVTHIGEADERKLYAREGSPSMFAYCTRVLHLSEAEAYLRITVARASRQHPMLLTMLGDGRLHLTGIALVLPLLTAENRDTLLKQATHRSKRQIKELIAQLSPRPDAPCVMRKLPEPRSSSLPPTLQDPNRPGAGILELRPDRVVALPEPAAAPAPALAPTPVAVAPVPPVSSSVASCTAGILDTPLDTPLGTRSAPPRPAVVEPLSPARYKVQFTASAELHDKLERLQALLRFQVPDGDLATIIEQAVTEKLERLEARRYATTRAPRRGLGETMTAPASRHVPAAVRRAVRERDGDRCGYRDEQGQRCSERHRLEFHHRHPFGLGGDHSPANIGLLCRAHNQLLGEHDYGRVAMSRRSGKEGSAVRPQPTS